MERFFCSKIEVNFMNQRRQQIELLLGPLAKGWTVEEARNDTLRFLNGMSISVEDLITLRTIVAEIIMQSSDLDFRGIPKFLEPRRKTRARQINDSYVAWVFQHWEGLCKRNNTPEPKEAKKGLFGRKKRNTPTASKKPFEIPLPGLGTIKPCALTENSLRPHPTITIHRPVLTNPGVIYSADGEEDAIVKEWKHSLEQVEKNNKVPENKRTEFHMLSLKGLRWKIALYVQPEKNHETLRQLIREKARLFAKEFGGIPKRDWLMPLRENAFQTHLGKPFLPGISVSFEPNVREQILKEANIIE